MIMQNSTVEYIAVVILVCYRILDECNRGVEKGDDVDLVFLLLPVSIEDEETSWKCADETAAAELDSIYYVWFANLSHISYEILIIIFREILYFSAFYYKIATYSQNIKRYTA